jgi:hypothetical protein
MARGPGLDGEPALARKRGRVTAPASATPTSWRRSRETPPAGAAAGAKGAKRMAPSGQSPMQLRQTWHSAARCFPNGSSAPWQSCTQRQQSVQVSGSTWIR